MKKIFLSFVYTIIKQNLCQFLGVVHIFIKYLFLMTFRCACGFITANTYVSLCCIEPKMVIPNQPHH